jgi:psp operon transcriptional activator
VERAVYRADGGRVEEIVFDPFARPAREAETAARQPPPDAVPTAAPAAPPDAAASPPASGTLRDAVARVEIDMLRRALAECRHHQRRAAARLGLTYHQFRGLYRKHARTLAAG